MILLCSFGSSQAIKCLQLVWPIQMSLLLFWPPNISIFCYLPQASWAYSSHRSKQTTTELEFSWTKKSCSSIMFLNTSHAEATVSKIDEVTKKIAPWCLSIPPIPNGLNWQAIQTRKKEERERERGNRGSNHESSWKWRIGQERWASLWRGGRANCKHICVKYVVRIWAHNIFGLVT